jgi:hypothetical protein
MKAFLAGVLFFVLPATASGEIVAWVDDQGVSHYTNVLEEIPKPYRDSVRTVVREYPGEPEEVAVAPEQPTRRELERPERRRLAQVVYDRPEISDEYVRGFAEGMAYAQGGNTGANIHIQGPLAVARADATAPYLAADPYYLDPYPFVTTAFDRGRSRHQTLRMLLQDQFQLDRSSPYIYPAQFLPPRLGVDLNPFHPRGLPRRFPRETRVIRR